MSIDLLEELLRTLYEYEISTKTTPIFNPDSFISNYGFTEDSADLQIEITHDDLPYVWLGYGMVDLTNDEDFVIQSTSPEFIGWFDSLAHQQQLSILIGSMAKSDYDLDSTDKTLLFPDEIAPKKRFQYLLSLRKLEILMNDSKVINAMLSGLVAVSQTLTKKDFIQMTDRYDQNYLLQVEEGKVDILSLKAKHNVPEDVQNVSALNAEALRQIALPRDMDKSGWRKARKYLIGAI